MTAADELSSSVSEDTGFCSATPLPSDPQELCDLTDSQETQDVQEPQDPQEILEILDIQEAHETESLQDPPDDLDPAPPPPLAIDTPPGSVYEEESQTGLPLSLSLPMLPGMKIDPDPDGTCGSVWEENVTQALKELDERCEEEEADFSDISR